MVRVEIEGPAQVDLSACEFAVPQEHQAVSAGQSVGERWALRCAATQGGVLTSVVLGRAPRTLRQKYIRKKPKVWDGQLRLPFDE